MLEVESDKLADCKLDITAVCVRVGFLPILGALDTGLSVLETFVKVLRKIVDSWNVRSCCYIQG